MPPREREFNKRPHAGGRKTKLLLGGLLLVALAVALFSQFPNRANVVNASPVATPTPTTLDLSTINALTVPGTVPAGYTFATYVPSGATASGMSAPDLSITFPPFGNPFLCDDITSCTHVLNPAAANSTDYHWLQSRDQPLIFDLGTPNCTALVFPSTDHRPAVYEALEFTVWGTNDTNAFSTFPLGWTQSTLAKVYADGWTDNGTSEETDDNASLWSFGGNSFRYVAVYANRSVHITPEPVMIGDHSNNNCFGQGSFCSDDAEIDAVGRPAESCPFCYRGINTGVKATIVINSLTATELCFTVTNNSVGATTGKITSIGVDLPGTMSGPFTLDSQTNNNYRLAENVPGNASGIGRTFEFALLTGPNFNGGANPNKGIVEGKSASFCIEGNFAGLTDQQVATGIFLRFQDVNPGGSDVAVNKPCS